MKNRKDNFMQVSARILGQEYGLTGEEMNRLLFKQGILTGEPGSYDLTSKGLQYAVSKDFHRGTGGYSHYNRYWTTRTYDESIKNILNFSSEVIAEVKKEVADARTLRYASQKAARAKEAAKKVEKIAEEEVTKQAFKRIARYKRIGKVGLVISGTVVTGYCIYKVTPKVKKWWIIRKEQTINKKEDDE